MTRETDDTRDIPSTKAPVKELIQETLIYTFFHVALPIGITYALYYAWAAQGWFSP